MDSDLVLDDPGIVERLREALERTYFATYDRAFLETPAGADDVADHVYKRYNDCVRYVVPWLSRHIDLGKTDIVGCGTGSSTAGLARAARAVHGYDIDARGIEAAESRPYGGRGGRACPPSGVMSP